METPPIEYARSGDLYIAYLTFGDGPIDLVVVPGFISHLEIFWEWPEIRHWTERLGSFARVLMFDKRGSGLSDRPGPHVTLEEMMDDVTAVMDAAGFERAALHGTGEGGPLSVLFAATYPERTSALVLYGTYAARTASDDYPWAPTPDVHDHAIEVYAQKWGRRPVGLGQAAPSVAGDEHVRNLYTRAQRMSATPGSAIAWYRMIREIDVRHVLPLVQAPTVVIHAAEDGAFPVEGARYMAERIPGAKLVEIAGRRDNFFFVDPDQIVDEIETFLTGARPAAPTDRILATVLFTDVVGSTERAAELGDRRWRKLLDEHDALVRRELERFRGREVKTVGDEFVAVFDGPARAVRCAQAIGSAVRSLGLEVRAGLHTGEVELRGEDIAGMAVHIGARVGALAEPGEVLVSSTVKDLVVGSDLEFEERGVRALKGVPGEWRLFCVVG